GMVGKYNITGTVYVLTKKKSVIELENSINEGIKKMDEISVGTSILPDESGIVVRILGNKTQNVSDIIFKILEISRKKILGASISKIRKN
ncbi:MAG: urease accessory protein UreD, partial [Nitrosopumilus sp.]